MQILSGACFVNNKYLGGGLFGTVIVLNRVHASRKIADPDYPSKHHGQNLIRLDSVSIKGVIVLTVVVQAAVRRAKGTALAKLLDRKLFPGI